MVHYVYIIVCDNYNKSKVYQGEVYYTGETWNPKERLQAHKSGKYRGSWTSRNNIVVKRYVYMEEVENKSIALKREYKIKHNQGLKLRLIKEYSER